MVVIDRVKDNWDVSRSIEDIHSIRNTENNQCNEEYKKNKSSITLSINPSTNNSPFYDLLAEHRYSTSRIHSHYLQSTVAISQRVPSLFYHSVIDLNRQLPDTNSGSLI